MIRRRKHICFKHLKLSSELFLVELNLQISDINCSKINTNRLCFAVLIHSVTESNTTDYYKPALNDGPGGSRHSSDLARLKKTENR